ncbi:hypothetical protein F2Q69_00014345 [Brassica cretica]|uniref:Uncharacterized protein n=1 Tax=Brassica cretica TaxID=69181 RepID=A0A8S9QM74_BRACR|nr:hypothetical protein F2Q69_00014345 [Brassica cretica]
MDRLLHSGLFGAAPPSRWPVRVFPSDVQCPLSLIAADPLRGELRLLLLHFVHARFATFPPLEQRSKLFDQQKPLSSPQSRHRSFQSESTIRQLLLVSLSASSRRRG